jgi:gliding motility-associated protein GldM
MAGGNLSPRQKMINMMYLVLTALLALNVSKEVLQSFFDVNQGIERTTTNFNSKNIETYAAFDNAAENNPVKYNEVKTKAYSVQNTVDPIVLYIQEMKYDLVMAVDKKVYLGKPSSVFDDDGKLIEEMALEEDVSFSSLSVQQQSMPIAHLNAKSNRDASGRTFVAANPETLPAVALKNRATILKKKIQEYKDLLIILAEGNQNLIDNINLVCNVSDKTGSDPQSWEEYNFVDMPAVGALTILSKIQSDLRNVEADVINYLKRNIDSKSLKFSGAEAAQIPKTNFVLRGDSFSSTIFISAKQEGNDPEIFVGDYDSLGGGKYQMIGDYETVKIVNGKGMFSKRTSAEGKKIWGGLIVMKSENGDKYYPFSGEYLVAAKQAVAAPTNMNVLYYETENPIKVSVPGYSASQITARTNNGTIKIVNKNKGEWVVVPNKVVKVNTPIISLYVNDDGKSKLMGTVDFKVKKVPDPKPRAAGLKKMVVSKGDLKASQMIIAELKDFAFDRKALSFQVISYDIVAYTSKGRSNYPTVKKTGGRFNDDVIKAINATAPGGTITFSNIKAKRKGVKERPRDLGSLVYTIK